MKKLCPFLFSLLFIGHVNAQWQSVGPYGATINCLAVKGNTVFAGTADAGIFRSSDNGNTWAAMNNGVNVQRSVNTLEIKGDSIYAGTMTSEQDQRGILFSSDNGDTWTGISDSIWINYFSLAFIGNRIIAGTENHGIRYSDDHGASWQVSDFYLPTWDNVKSLVVADSLIVAGTSNGVHISTDSGATWTEQFNTLPPQFNFGPNVSDLAFKNGTLYIANYNWLFKSTDYGDNWSSVGYALGDIKAIVFKGDTLIAGVEDEGVYLSVNNGVNLVNIYSGISPYDHSVSAIAILGNTFLAGTNVTGIIASNDNGITWSESNTGMPPLIVNSTTTIGNNLIASTWYAGTQLSQDNGNSWQYLPTGIPEDYSFTAFAKNGTDLYGAAGLMYHSGDSGLTWTPLATTSTTWAIRSIAVSGNMLLAASDYYVYYSTDAGQTISGFVNNGLPYNSGYETVAFHHEKIYVGNHFYGCYVSSDSGATWVTQNNGLPWSPTYTSTLASYGGTLYMGLNNGRIYRSFDDGLNWYWAANGLTGGGTVTSILPMGNNILAQHGSSLSRLSFSSNNGTSWTDADEGIPIGTGLNSELSVNEDYFFTGGTHGVHRRPISELIPGWVDCSAGFTVQSDTTIENNWQAISTSTGASPISYNWSWGDGTYSNTAEPSHIYDVSGDYTMCLAITDVNGCIAEHCDDFTFNAVSTCSAGFTLYPDTAIEHNWFVLNTSTSTSTPSYTWSWGDGDTSTGPNPSHTYSSPGYYTICVTISNTNGCSDTYCDSSTYVYKTGAEMVTVNVVDQLPNGIEEIESNSIHIYPNPANSFITVVAGHVSKQLEVNIHNTRGQLVYQGAMNNYQSTIDISTLSKGIYFLSVFDGKQQVYKKLVKE